MKVLCSAAIFCVAFLAYLNYTSAYAHYKREASPYANPFADPHALAEPEPGIAKKVAGFCNETMVTAKSPKQFCKAVSEKIVEKVNHLCHKAVKLTCKMFNGDLHRKCKKFLYGNLCPVIEGATTPDPVLEDESENDVPARKKRFAEPNALANPEPRPTLELYAVNVCEKKMAGIFESINTQEENFNPWEFCKGMRKSVKKECITSMHDFCDKAPWKSVVFVCKEYLAPWLCK